MKTLRSILLVAALVFVVAAAAACLSFMVASRFQTKTSQEAHDWVHTQLALTAEQEKALAPIEAAYQAKRRDLEQRLLLANRQLAEAIVADRKDSPRVHEAVANIHTHMGNLQILTIQHVFEMEPTLTPAQYDRLLNLTANALYHLDSHHGIE
jgi:Spy/CpxP family protein refolding chaperone